MEGGREGGFDRWREAVVGGEGWEESGMFLKCLISHHFPHSSQRYPADSLSVPRPFLIHFYHVT